MRPKLGKNNQQWIFDYLIRSTGRTAHWETDAAIEKLPPEVKSWAMIPKVGAKKAAGEEEFARRAEAAGHVATAWEAYSRAARSYFNAQHHIVEDDNAEKIRLNEKMRYCNEKVRKYGDHSVEKLEIPWGDKTVPALLHLVPGAKKAPCVLHIPGMDSCKEMFPTFPNSPAVSPNPFMHRGMHVLAVDLPGQGECNLRKIRANAYAHKEAGRAAVDYLMTRPEVDGSKIGLYGVSMGSYWGSDIAGADNRIKATVTTLGCYFMDRHAIFDEASPRFRLTFKYMAGIEDDEEFDRMITGMHLKGVGPKIKNPFLMWIGEFDPLCPMEEAQKFFNEIAGPKEMWIMEDDFHAPFTRALRSIPMPHFAADWLKDKLEGKFPRDMNRKVLIPLNGAGPYS